MADEKQNDNETKVNTEDMNTSEWDLADLTPVIFAKPSGGNGSGGGDDKGEKGPGKGSDQSKEDGEEGEEDQIAKDIENKLSKKSVGAKPGNIHAKKDKDSLNDGENAYKGKGGSAQNIGWQYVPPRYNWKKYLDKIISSVSARPEETYLKPSSSAATTASVMSQRGAAVVKPGEVKPEGNIKLCIVVDSSGSMGETISKIYSEIKNMLKKYKRLDNNFLFIRFSDSYEIFHINVKSNKFGKADSFKAKPKIDTYGADKLFTEHYGAGTNFSSSLAAECLAIAAAGYHVTIITDDDIGASTNFSNLQKVLQNRNTGIIFSKKEYYISLIKKMGRTDYVTFFE